MTEDDVKKVNFSCATEPKIEAGNFWFRNGVVAPIIKRMNALTAKLLSVLLALTIGLTSQGTLVTADTISPCHVDSEMVMHMAHDTESLSSCELCDGGACLFCQCALSSAFSILGEAMVVMDAQSPQSAMAAELPRYLSSQLFRPPRG